MGLSPVCDAGMEASIDSDVLVSKNPEYSFNIPKLAGRFHIPLVFVPVRDLTHTAKSRVRVGVGNGGLWNARNYTEQVFRHAQAFYQLIFDCNRLEIPFVLIDFQKMMSDKEYLYKQLQPLTEWAELDHDLFCEEYDKLFDPDKIHIQ